MAHIRIQPIEGLLRIITHSHHATQLIVWQRRMQQFPDSKFFAPPPPPPTEQLLHTLAIIKASSQRKRTVRTGGKVIGTLTRAPASFALIPSSQYPPLTLLTSFSDFVLPCIFLCLLSLMLAYLYAHHILVKQRKTNARPARRPRKKATVIDAIGKETSL